MGLLIKQLYSN